MRLRSKSEIQTSAYVPIYTYDGYTASCYGQGSGRVSSPRIHYNDKYSYGTGPTLSNYHRDNYCIIPLVVPSMTVSDQEESPVSDELSALIPQISTMFGLQYTYAILNAIWFDYIITASGTTIKDISFPTIATINKCRCDCGSSGYSDVCSGTDKRLPAPFDVVINNIESISDEYASNWPSTWDMEKIYNSGRKPSKRDESSSSSGILKGMVYLCTASTTGVGVGIVRINGSGGTSSAGGSITVNFPLI